MNKDDAATRKFYNDLAKRLSEENGLDLARDLQRAGLLGQRAAQPEPAAPAANTDAPRPISIWQPRERDGATVFERPTVGIFGDHYADQRRFTKEKPPGKLRICLFGESVAAGYLYAPHLTPAKVMAHQLNAVEPGRFEVIDLARTNETLAGLSATVEAAMQLAPDGLVLFTGNNWSLLEEPTLSPYTPSVAGRQTFAATWSGDDGVGGPVRHATQTVLKKAASHLQRIAEVSAHHGVPVVMVIPEVNQADWGSLQPPVWLPGDGNAAWFRHWSEAQASLRAGDWDAAAAAATAMMDLDQETNPTSCRLLAQAKAGSGRHAMARAAFEAESTLVSLASMCFLDSPRIPEPARELQRRIAQVHHFHAIDCREVFRRLDPAAPGRRWFLDYCHLTREGMRVVMAATTQAVKTAVGKPLEREPDEWIDQAPLPDVPPQVGATAMFGAAMHTAHRMAEPSLLTGAAQGESITAHWCRQALRASPAIAATMIDIAAIRASGVPAALHAAQQRNLQSDYQLTPQHGWRFDAIDGNLLQTLQTVLAEQDPDAANAFRHALIEASAIRRGRTGLHHGHLLPYHLDQPVMQRFTDLLPRADHQQSAIYRATWPVTGVTIIHEHGDLALKLCARLPLFANKTARKGQATIKVNGREAVRIDLTERWTNHQLNIHASQLLAGLNQLTIHWPDLPTVGEAALHEALTRLKRGIEANIHPTFAEIQRW